VSFFVKHLAFKLDTFANGTLYTYFETSLDLKPKSTRLEQTKHQRSATEERVLDTNTSRTTPWPIDPSDRSATIELQETTTTNVGSSKNLGRATFRKMPEAGLKIAQKGLKNTFFGKNFAEAPSLGRVPQTPPHAHVWTTTVQ